MAKEKKAEKKAKGSLPNKNVHLRLSFLHQAAKYLSESATQINPPRTRRDDNEAEGGLGKPGNAQARYLTNHMKGVSRKSVVRLDKAVKRSICKGCDELLANNHTARESIENRSKCGRKTWADVLVVECERCGTLKRFPVGAKAMEDRTVGHECAGGTQRGVQK